jgi:hypothetical protein
LVSDNEETTQDRRSLHSEAAASPEDISPSPLPNYVPYLEHEDDSDEEDQPKVIEFSSGLIGTPNGRILVTKKLRENILKRFHDSPYAGHLGTKKTIARITRRYI